MKHAIIVSTQDPAGMNIKEHLTESFGFTKREERLDGHPVFEKGKTRLYTTDTDTVHCERIDQKIPEELIIFATKHQSTSGIHSLSLHTPGNWGTAEYGGSDKKLCIAPADYLRHGLLLLEEAGKDMHYEIVQECTHHGPYLEKPCMFIEIGSSIEEWKNQKAGEAIAGVIIELIEKKIPQCKTAFGIGGLHTTPNFAKVIHRSDYGFGHVCPKYMLPALDAPMIEQAMERNTHPVDSVILDWKGLKTEKERILKLLKDIGIDYQRTNDF